MIGYGKIFFSRTILLLEYEDFSATSSANDGQLGVMLTRNKVLHKTIKIAAHAQHELSLVTPFSKEHYKLLDVSVSIPDSQCSVKNMEPDFSVKRLYLHISEYVLFFAIGQWYSFLILTDLLTILV